MSELEKIAKYPHEIKLTDYYEPCKGKECSAYSVDCSSEDYIIYCCGYWQVGCCIKTAKPEHRLIPLSAILGNKETSEGKIL